MPPLSFLHSAGPIHAERFSVGFTADECSLHPPDFSTDVVPSASALFPAGLTTLLAVSDVSPPDLCPEHSSRGAHWPFRPSVIQCPAPAETLAQWAFLALGIELPPLSSSSSPPAPCPAPNFPPSPGCQGHVSMAVSWLICYLLWS